MYRIAKRFKSLAEGELPLDDISEWKVNENDPVDHFLFQSENSFGRKDIIKMKGLKRNPFKSLPRGLSTFCSSSLILIFDVPPLDLCDIAYLTSIDCRLQSAVQS